MKQLIEYLNEAIKQPKIYIDMDGVLTDFKKEFKKIDGRTTEEIEKINDEAFWKHVKKGGLKFWSHMDWIKDSKKLWSFIKKYNPTILSAPARSLPDSPKGKQIWIKRELGNPPLILKRAKEKHQHADKNSILIDDNKDVINNWNNAGGIGILFVSANQTIKKLKEILNEI